METLAIIPARSGSKRIPGKNIKLLGGHPLIAYSIAAGLHSRLVGRVIVSTDSDEIATISRQYGAEVPFLRPAALAQDHSTDWEAFHHALAWLDEYEDYRPDIIVHLRPTVPFRAPDLVDTAVALLRERADADSVRSLVPFELTPYKMWRVIEDGFVRPVAELPNLHEAYNLPNQQLPPTYLHSGHIDVMRWSVVMEQQSMSGGKILPLFIDPHYIADIDLPSDWENAEKLLAALHLPYIRPITPTTLSE